MMTIDEVLEYFRNYLVEIGEYIIQYNGKKEDTILGKTESWIIIRKIPYFEKGEDNE